MDPRTRFLTTLVLAAGIASGCGGDTHADDASMAQDASLDGDGNSPRDGSIGTDSSSPDVPDVGDATSRDAVIPQPDAMATDAMGVDVTGTDATTPDVSAVDVTPIDVVTADSMPTQPTCPANYPRIDLRADSRAVGDGIADDTDAFQRAAAAIQMAGGGELTIPPGTYRVGRQRIRSADAGTGPYYTPAPIFTVQNLACLRISGYGAVMKLTAGLHYGAFDPATGAALTTQTTSQNAVAHVGRMIEVSNSSNVLVEGVELDGNSSALVLGGGWGNVDRQAQATGIWFNQCSDVHVVDVHTHHHALDGVGVLYVPGPPPRRMPHLLERVNAEYNGRQGISWIGGWGLEVVDSQFNHTGRAVNHGGGVDDGMPLASAPKAGLDIEPNGGTTEMSREGVFTRCEFVDNAGPGMDAAVGDGGYSTFDDCTFWGTTTYSVWANRPGLRFVNSRFYGTGVHASDGHSDADPTTPIPALATYFDNCTFEDRPWTDGNVYRNNNLYTISSGAEGVTWHDCTFIAHQTRALYIGGTTNQEIFDNCSFEMGDSSLATNSQQALFQGSRITSCHFSETAAVSNGSNAYYVSVNTVTVGTPAAGANPTVVDGPRIHWKATNGPTGTIAPGNY